MHDHDQQPSSKKDLLLRRLRWKLHSRLLAILSRLRLLQRYARFGRLKVPAELYDRKYFLSENGCEGAKEFLAHRGHRLSGRLAAILGEIRDIDGHAFLDLGCGRGEILTQLETRASRVVGIDYSESAIEISRRTVKKAEVIHADVVQFLPEYEAEPFDGILLIDLVEHLFDWELTILLKQVSRLLKLNGLLYVDTPLLADRPYSQMHVNVKQSAEDYLVFLPDFIIERQALVDPVGQNHLILFRRIGRIEVKR
jgi:2-polyprenyl-3-methyl-5-hydroxy-6-metoxy-1,4-benzoquinol methylase